MISLPKKPVVVIEASQDWVSLNFSDLWNYRDLLYILIERDIKVRYRQTLLGVAWAIIQPLFTMLVFTLFFGTLANIPTGDVPYSIFAYTGLLPWVFFSNAVTNSANSLIGNSNLITKVYFPRLIIPIAVVAAGLVDFAISLVLLIGLMLYYDRTISWNLLMFPILLILITLLASGVGILMSALNVKFRDVRHALPFTVQLLMFVTPIIYPLSLVPEKWQWLLKVNPLTGLIEGFRSVFLNLSFDWIALGCSTFISTVIFICAIYIFRRFEKDFADII